MRIDLFMVSVLLGMTFLIVGVSVIVEQSEVYDVPFSDKTYENVSILMSEVSNTSIDIKDGVKFSDVGEDSAEDQLFTGGFRSIIQQWGYFRAVGEIMSGTAKAFGVPTIFFTMMTIILLLLAAWALIYMVFRFMPRG